VRHELEDSAGGIRVIADTERTCDGLGKIGDDAVTPAADLVAEQSKAAQAACADGALGDDAAFRVLVPRRCLLDD
jgi:hypothetical protein